ncbi:NrsF family protein [Rhizobium sp. PL01]|uniref:NrsF family protein n=1 Tax=Rhizobium sp. PL01 TaxID=3085631 RepID=UPI0029821837|nr:NrsF family protein [Rhizobium sp. PL01]MDW5318403.1 NrsF family protein [Rhizobium sp. PL01]
MQTNDLVNALKVDVAKQAMPLGYAWWVAIVTATIIAAGVFFVLIGPRPDFAVAAHTLRFLFKFTVTLTLAVVAFTLLQVLSRPGSNVRRVAHWLVLTPVLIGAAVMAELFVVPPDQLLTVWWGSNVYVCLTFIPLIGLGPLAVFLTALRHGAPTRPGLAGAVAGLLAGSIAATFYAAHCTDDSPLFVATWYSIAIAGLVVLGTILGRRVARW